MLGPLREFVGSDAPEGDAKSASGSVSVRGSQRSAELCRPGAQNTHAADLLYPSYPADCTSTGKSDLFSHAVAIVPSCSAAHSGFLVTSTTQSVVDQRSPHLHPNILHPHFAGRAPSHGANNTNNADPESPEPKIFQAGTKCLSTLGIFGSTATTGARLRVETTLERENAHLREQLKFQVCFPLRASYSGTTVLSRTECTPDRARARRVPMKMDVLMKPTFRHLHAAASVVSGQTHNPLETQCLLLRRE